MQIRFHKVKWKANLKYSNILYVVSTLLSQQFYIKQTNTLNELKPSFATLTESENLKANAESKIKGVFLLLEVTIRLGILEGSY